MVFLSKLFTIFLLSLSLTSFALVQQRSRQIRTFTSIYALSPDQRSQLDEMKAKYDKLSNVVSEEADSEKKSLQQIVDKYSTYNEINLMMSKIRSIYLVERSEPRKERQLKSFMQLYKGKLELEEILKASMGAGSSSEVPATLEMAEVEKFDAELEVLEQKLKSVELKVSPGKSTREARFEPLQPPMLNK